MKQFLIGVFAVFFMSPFSIRGDSMEPAFSSGDTIMFESLTYTMDEPERGDIVVFYGTDDPEKVFVKRIIGMPGEEIQIKERIIYIDGEKLAEPYLGEFRKLEDMSKREYDAITYKVPAEKYFLLGDNREKSFDSRTWNDPFVPRDNIFGKYYFDVY